jgi:hypothetical protein
MSVTADNGVKYANGQAYYDHLLTNYFLQLLPDARNNSNVLLSMIDKRPTQAVSGRFIVFPVRFGRSTGLNNVGYGGIIPDPGAQNAATYSTMTRKGMARIALDGDTIRHGKTNGGAYAEAMQIEMEGIIDDIMIDRARQVHNDGSGRLAEVKSFSGTEITLKVNSSIEGAATTRAAGTLDKYIEVGMRIAAFDNAAAAHTFAASTNQVYVKEVTVSGADVKIKVASTPGGAALTIAGTLANNDWLVRCSQATGAATVRVDSGYRTEMMGIGGVYSDANVLDGVGLSGAQQTNAGENLTATATGFQGLDAASYDFNRGIVLDNGAAGNRPLTEELMQQAISDAEEINNANVELLLSSFPTYNSYVKLLTPDKRYNNTLELAGGHKTLTFNGIGWVKDRYCYQNRVYFLALDQFHILETAPLQPLVGGDVTTWERLAEYDKYWRGWTWEDNMIVEVRNRTGAVLTELAS